MEALTISEIQVIPVKPQNGLVAFASCVINSQFYLGNIAVYSTTRNEDRIRLVFPTKVFCGNKQLSCFHPINRTTEELLRRVVAEAYWRLFDQRL